jgi:hypothetical protein
MNWQRAGGGVWLVLLLGACEVEVQRPPPRPPPRYYYYATRPPPPQGQVIFVQEQPPPEVRAPAPPPPQPVSARFPTRIVHPLPLADPGAQFLDLQGLQALVLRVRPNRKCGPRELSSGHWIHLDCNVHAPIKSAKTFTPDKINMLLQGLLNLDTPITIPTIPGLPSVPGVPGTGGTTAGSSTPPATKPGITGALPDAVDHRKDGTEGPVKDQGQVGACTAFSLSTAMDNAIRRQNGTMTTSTLHIWSHYGNPIVQNAGDKNLKKPIAPWESWPYDERIACELDQSGDHDCGPYTPAVTQGSGAHDATLQAKVKDSDERGQWSVTEYDRIPSDPDTLAAILATGTDVWTSMDIGTTWLTTVGENIVDWTALNTDGGHAFVLAGYRHVGGQRQFLVHNSWGATWGDKGYAYVSEAMIKGFLKTSYKVVVASKAAPAPVPTETNKLTDDDCATDQVVDSVTGQCAKICPNDSRPANGKCTAGKH